MEKSRDAEIGRILRHIQLISSGKDDEIRLLRQALREYYNELSCVNENIREYQEVYRDLCLKIEQLHYQQSKVDSSDFDATPPLLQAAVDSVSDSITACASELLCRIKNNSSVMNLHIRKVALRSFLCYILFRGFEDAASKGLPLFEKPTTQKARFFHAYKCWKDVDAKQMLDEERDFFDFFQDKRSELCTGLIEDQQLLQMDAQRKEEFITSEVLRSSNNRFESKLLRLVKAVWVLRNLAFAFEPTSAEIFRVGQGSVFDEEFMENIARHEEDDDGDKMAQSSVPIVSFMCVPGFIVRHTIIKSRVLVSL